MAGEVVAPGIQNFNASQHFQKTISFGPATTSGTSTATGATSLTDSGAAWVVNAYAGKTCYSDGKSGVISSNTSTVITVASWTGGTPTAVKTYMVGAAGINGGIAAVTCLQASANLIIRQIIPFSSSQLLSVNTTATLTLGLATKSATFFLAATAVSVFTSSCYWVTTTPEAYGILLPAGFKDIIITPATSVTMTVAVEEVTAGNVGFDIFYDPITAGATLT